MVFLFLAWVYDFWSLRWWLCVSNVREPMPIRRSLSLGTWHTCVASLRSRGSHRTRFWRWWRVSDVRCIKWWLTGWKTKVLVISPRARTTAAGIYWKQSSKYVDCLNVYVITIDGRCWKWVKCLSGSSDKSIGFAKYVVWSDFWCFDWLGIKLPTTCTAIASLFQSK